MGKDNNLNIEGIWDIWGGKGWEWLLMASLDWSQEQALNFSRKLRSQVFAKFL